MTTSLQPIAVFSIVLSLLHFSSTQPCSKHIFSRNRVFNSCSDLPYLDAHLHWNYLASTKRVQIAYRAAQDPAGWIAWAINPTGTGMIGSQALVAFRNQNGRMIAYATPITSYSPSMLPGVLTFHVSSISAEYLDNEMTIFAVIGPLFNGTKVNVVWQRGDSVLDNIPQVHAISGPNIQSMGELEFQTTGGTEQKMKL